MLLNKCHGPGFHPWDTRQTHNPSSSGKGVWVSLMWLLRAAPPTDNAYFLSPLGQHSYQHLTVVTACVSRSTDQHMKKRRPWQLMHTSFTSLIFLVVLALRRHISNHTLLILDIILHTVLYSYQSHWILRRKDLREGNVAVCSLCVYDHTCTCAHSLNRSKTKHRILKPSNLIDNTGKSIKLSWSKRLWPSLCSSTALLEIAFIAKKQAWLQGCLITHNDTKSILFIPTSNSTLNDADLHGQKDLSKWRHLIIKKSEPPKKKVFKRFWVTECFSS